MNVNDINALFEREWQGELAAWARASRCGSKPEGIPLSRFFHPEAAPAPCFRIYAQSTCRAAYVSQWSKAWLRLFVGHFVWLLHRHRRILTAPLPHIHLQCGADGLPQTMHWDSRHTRLLRLHDTDEAALGAAYDALFHILDFGFAALARHGTGGTNVLWHNAANLIEYCLNLMGREHPDVAHAYRILLQSPVNIRGRNRLYRAVEYVPSFHPAIAGSIRLRRICCLRYQIPAQHYCATCPKLKTISRSQLNTLFELWQHED